LSSDDNRTIGLIVGISIGALVAAGIASYFIYQKHHVKTDDLTTVLYNAHETVRQLNEAIESLKA